ncbi:MAG: virginiamycin B lyase family protein [Nitrososphaera sp.]|uniref:Vgb family protein n=1 Tax=Nitrososphaera sp. TaxID=1971748 RepID=UPI003D6F595B
MTANNSTLTALLLASLASVALSSMINVPVAAQQQQQAINSPEDLATYQKKSNFIKEFVVPVQERGLKGITTGIDGSIWFIHSSNKTGTIFRLDSNTGKFAQYALDGVTVVDDVIINLAASQLVFDRKTNAIWFTDARTNSIGRLDVESSKIDRWKIPTDKAGPMGIALSPDDKSIWFTEITGNKIGKFEKGSKQFAEYPTGEDTGPALLTFDDRGVIWVSLTFAGSVLRVEPWALVPDSPSPSLSGMTKMALPQPDRFNPFGIAITSGRMYVSDHSSSRIVVSDAESNFRSYTSYWTSPPDSFLPTTLPSQVISDKEGNIYFAQHGGNRIAEIRVTDGILTEYEIPTGPLSTALYLSEGQDGKIWFVEWASNRVAYLDTSVDVPFELQPKESKSITLGANGSKSIVAVVSAQPQANNNGAGKSQEIELSLTGMSESGLKDISFTASPAQVKLPDGAGGGNRSTSTIESNIVVKALQNAKSGGYTVMVRALTQENDGLVISKLYPLSLVLDLPQSAGADNQGQPTMITTDREGELSVRETIQILALGAAAGLIGYIVYRRIKGRKTAITKD